MRRSIGWHFFLYSLAIILVAVVAVGTVTLLLVDANFSRQEEQYLLDRGDHLVEPLQSVFQWGGDPAELQGVASFGLLTGHVRIRVVDRYGQLLADSGSYDELFEARAFRPDNAALIEDPSLTALQLFLDEAGNYRGFQMPAAWPEDIGPFMMPGRQRRHIELPEITAEAAPQPPIAAISEAAVSFPLHVDSQVVGYAEVSEGPAFGRAIRDTLQQALLIGGLAALVVAALAAVVAARQVTRPLLSLREAADEMARGNLEARAGGSQLAEIDRLSGQFNTMADRLAATIASLEAERASLRRFIADASHELRTPLTALKTFNALLGESDGLAAENRTELIAESGRQIDHLDRLTSDLLDLSRLEARLSGTGLVTGDIRPVLSEAVAALRPLSDAKAQRLQQHVPSDPVVVAHDPAALERAIQNLLSNAVKFTPPGGLIQIDLLVDDQYAAIYVEDEGPGIPPAEQPLIFGRFYRGRGESGSGSGLGLAIAREIAAIHGGEITFSSSEGDGSQFVLRLPIAGE